MVYFGLKLINLHILVLYILKFILKSKLMVVAVEVTPYPDYQTVSNRVRRAHVHILIQCFSCAVLLPSLSLHLHLTRRRR